MDCYEFLTSSVLNLFLLIICLIITPLFDNTLEFNLYLLLLLLLEISGL